MGKNINLDFCISSSSEALISHRIKVAVIKVHGRASGDPSCTGILWSCCPAKLIEIWVSGSRIWAFHSLRQTKDPHIIPVITVPLLLQSGHTGCYFSHQLHIFSKSFIIKPMSFWKWSVLVVRAAWQLRMACITILILNWADVFLSKLYGLQRIRLSRNLCKGKMLGMFLLLSLKGVQLKYHNFEAPKSSSKGWDCRENQTRQQNYAITGLGVCSHGHFGLTHSITQLSLIDHRCSWLNYWD